MEVEQAAPLLPTGGGAAAAPKDAAAAQEKAAVVHVDVNTIAVDASVRLY